MQANKSAVKQSSNVGGNTVKIKSFNDSPPL